MKKVLVFLSISLVAFAQIQFLPISADYASFYATDSTAYLEIYASLFQGNLKYLESEPAKYVASFTSNMELTQNEVIVHTLSHNYQNTTEDTAIIQRYNQFVDIFPMEVPYGDYRAKLQIIDNHSLVKGEYILDVKTIKPSVSIFLSDIELCSHVSKDTVNSIFYKNQLRVIPNPRRVFDLLQPMLYYYVEINNLPYDHSEKRFYEFDYFITTKEGELIKSKDPLTKEIFGKTLVEVGALNVMALPQNTYFINTRVKDLSNNVVATSRRMFIVHKPSPKDTVISESKFSPVAEVYSGFSKEDLENEFQMARYIARRDEEKVFKNLENAEAMKKFLTEFWQARDKEFNLSAGSARLSYMQRVAYANANYGSMGKAGWKSDRGRVLLIYGEPDDYERYPSSMDVLPYIIWRYHNLEGGQYFIFTDLDGFGEYQLIHSTYRKELQNPDWQSLIQKGGTTISY